MDFDSAIASRKSVRTFQTTKVNFRDLMMVVDAAIKAPFAGNLNNLRFVIIEDSAKIERIAEASAQDWINEAQAMIVVCADETDLENKYDERGRVYSRQHSGAAIENLLLKITDLGLSACWVGAFNDEQVRRVLEIPANISIEAVIPIGYERKDKTKKKAEKMPLDDAIYWERWKARKRPGAFTGEDSPGAPPVTTI